MKLSKPQQQQLNKAYHTLIQVCLYDMPIREMVPYLANDVMNFGAGRKDLTKTKAAFLEQIKNQKKLARGLKMDFKIKPVLRKITSNANGAIFTDDIINTVWVNGTANKLQFRLSFIFEYDKKRWVLVHSHTSTPDHQRSDNEVWPVEELRKRTAVLEKSLDEKIAELEVKNRELQIENALEKVRARTMAMQRSDELSETATVLFQEFKKLDENPIQITIGIVNEAAGVIEFSGTDWGGSGSQLNQIYGLSIKEPTVIKKVYAGWKKQKKSIVIDLTGQNLEDWIGYRNVATGVTIRSKDTGGRRVIGVAFFSKGHISISTNTSLPSKTISLLERFAGVFDGTYTRFLDLKQAEAQTREAQIETSLERVRSKTMAMYRSQELSEVISVLSQQLYLLGFHVDNAMFNTNYHEKDWNLWMAYRDKPYPEQVQIPYFDHPFFNHFKDAVANEATIASSAMNKKEKDRLLDHLYGNSALANLVPDELKKLAYGKPGASWSVALLKFISVGVLNFDAVPYTDEQNSILKRFGSVFEQSYIRFLDLQKAEAQAEEARIETALEKVRSRSLAMHKSEELQEVVDTVFARLKELNFEVHAASIVIPSIEAEGALYWVATDALTYSNSIFIPSNFQGAIGQDVAAALADGSNFFAKTYCYKEKNEMYQYLFENTDFGLIPEDRKRFILGSKSVTFSASLAGKIAIQLVRFNEVSFSEKENATLKRFARVFEQAYVRFLDLMKAEQQAEEAQIENALEKVRSRSLAMHKSEELQEVVNTLFERMHELGIDNDSTNILLNPTEGSRDIDFWIANETHAFSTRVFVPHSDHLIINEALDARDSGKDLFSKTYTFEEKNKWFNYAFEHSDLRHSPEERKQFILSSEAYTISVAFTKNAAVHLSRYSKKIFSERENDILKRFARVFEQAYIRFLDLQKAEEQAREATIEASLERVRSKTMAMHNSQDVGNTVAIMFDELVKLGVETNRCGILIMDQNKPAEAWTAKASTHGEATLIIGHFAMTIHPMLENAYAAWVAKESSFSYEMIGEDLKAYYRAITSTPNYSIQFDIDSLPERQFHTDFFFPDGCIFAFTREPLQENASIVFKRFAGVFGQTYRRYLDLKKAESQAREAKIEAALERVRYRAMAMQNSDDVWLATATMFTELDTLEIETLRCGILVGDESETMEVWSVSKSAEGKVIKGAGRINMNTTPLWKAMYKTWRQKQDFLFYPLAGKEKDDYYKVITGMNNYLTGPIEEMPDQFTQAYFFGEGTLWAFSKNPHSEADKNVLKKFTGVFALTFRRFQDLKKAEEQAREAKIEASLERVRSRTLAMQSSNELAETSVVVLQQLIGLGIQPNRLYIAIIKDDDGRIEFWVTDEKGTQVSNKFIGNSNDNLSFKKMYDGWKEEKKSIVIDMQGKELEEYLQHLTTLGVPFNKDFQVRREHTVAYFSKGFMGLVSFEPQPRETTRLLERFAGVFNLTFTRYLDLKQAEEQAREAVIEAALEKVRGKAMAMHSSNDLIATASQVFTELRKLGIKPMLCGVGLLTKENRQVQLYAATSGEGENLSLAGSDLLDGHPVLSALYDSWLTGEDYFPVLKGDEVKTYYEKLKSNFVVPESQTLYEQHGYFLPFSEGYFYGWSEKPFSESEIKTLNRFKTIIDLTFRRYVELQKSEGSARDAIRQASLDRVRAEIASMRTTSDLEKITPLIWRELTTLGIPFIRCGVFIMDEAKELCHAFLSTPEGKAIAAVEMPYASGIIKDAIAPWRHKQVYTDHWDAKRFIEFWQEMTSMGANASQTQYQLEHPPENLHLYFLPFLQGMLYAGNVAPLGEDDMSLLQSVADAFSTAYARYEDFNKLETAKKQVENTLTDLKLAQTQLIQSEKMASLGELTAGIAHEIQNPLNFVNNFSEVSNELLDEMEAEIDKGNAEDAKALAHDVKKNLEKILHHGKRADSIVKGMLQHSRSSSGVKEAVDINALADEYLRLAYHGLRAKDKSFNAAFKTDFDTAIGKVNVLQQDLGRVILNLLTNAFYAVTEKSKGMKPGEKYEPTVTVTTKKIGDKSDNYRVEIRVSDNGNGIPMKVQDKIFQPFFTTKPTGQGTGLGLSLSYDIVTKGHGGELRVETKEGEGSTFVIVLPMS